MIDLIALRHRGEFVLPAYAVTFHRGVQLNGMTFTPKPEVLHIRGSLAKAIHGNNVQPMSFSDVCAGIAWLEQVLETDLDDAEVNELEFGAVVATREPCGAYLRTWGPVAQFKQVVTNAGQTVLYTNGNTSFQGYDKALQMRLRGIPEAFLNHYLMRLEQKYKRNRLRVVFGEPVYVKHLRNHLVYVELVERWHTAYKRIPKGGTARPRFVTSTRELITWLAAGDLGSPGRLAEVSLEIKQSRALSPNQKRTMRSRLRGLSQQGQYIEPTDLTVELDGLVQAWAEQELGTNRGHS